MLTFLTMLACSQPEAAEPPLPAGAAEFRATLQSFQTMRMWMRAPEFNGLTDGKFWFGKRFILSFRNDGVLAVDEQGQRSRYRWGPEGMAVDVNVFGQDRPASSRPPTIRRFNGIERTEQDISAAISILRSPQTPWLARGPGHYGWAVQSDQYAEVTIPALAERGCHMFLRFGEYAAPRYLIFQCSRKQMLSLDILRVEVDPPLPSTWFDPDAPEMDTRTPGDFGGGEPNQPLNPGFYAPGATPPPAYGVTPPPPGAPPPNQPGQ